MKKSICIFLGILIAIVFPALSPAQGVWVGAFAGGDFGKINYHPDGTAYTTMSPSTGLAIGAEIDDPLSEYVWFCGQVSYVQKGGSSVVQSPAYTRTDFALSYFTLTPLIKATAHNNDWASSLFFGPSIGLNMSATKTVTTDDYQEVSDLDRDKTSKVNLGLILGGALSYKIQPSTMLFIQVALDFGLTNVNPSSSNTPENPNITTYDGRLTAGIMFLLGK
jgi:hypothetical protein